MIVDKESWRAKLAGIVIAVILGILLILSGRPWIALVALLGPVGAWIASILGVSGAAIMTFLSGGGSFQAVAGIIFIIAIALGIASFFI